MTQLPNELEIPPVVQQTMQHVRRSIRAYVWLEGLAALVVTVGVLFWLGLGLDWLFEPSRGIRIAALAIFAAITAWVAYRWLLRRIFVRLPDSALAVLLERRFPQLRDHLLTAVDLAKASELGEKYEPGLVAQTNQAAAEAVAGLPSGELLRRGPLMRAIVAALLLVASIPIFAATSSDTFRFWMERIGLTNEPWPRRVHLAVVGFEPNDKGIRVHKIAQDDDYELLVKAQNDAAAVPDEVEIRFRLADGRRGRDTMIRVGDAVPERDEYQVYRYQFKHVAGDMTFDVVGGDDRVRDLHLAIVDRPELAGMEVECVYPEYLARPPRQLPVTGGMRIPEGTHLVLRANATKPLAEVRLHTAKKPDNVSLPAPPERQSELQWDYGTLAADDVVTIHITDQDGITSREPYRISFSALPDELPQLAVRLDGIANAITPDAVIPFSGQITDDYGLAKIWFAYQVDDGPSHERPFLKQPDGEQTRTALDRFDTRDSDTGGSNATGGERALQLKPGETLYLTLKAADRCDLSGTPRAGSSQQFTLDVVTVAQLLALVERRELELRQRFETIIAKVTDTRNLLSRVDFNDQTTSAASDTTESESPGEASASPAAAPERALARRRLRVAGSLQNITQSAHEVLDLSQAFADIHDQLENNRIDNADLKSRLQDQIALPLRQIGEKRLAELETQLQLAESKIADATAGPPLLADSVRQADAVIVEMQQVLTHMLELESYNEVVALLRGIIHDQSSLNERTKQQQTDRIKSILDE